MKTHHSSSSEETKGLGAALARRIRKGRKAVVFALKGELGAGKTTFVQGFLKGLGLAGRAPSPTFVIMRRHPLRRRGFSNVFHVDAYRLKKAEHLAALGFKEVLADLQNVVLVEWADRVKRILPKNAIWLHFRHGGGHRRTISIRKRGRRA